MNKLSLTERMKANQPRRDEQANIELAEEIAGSGDPDSVREVVANITDKELQSDAIKTVYEIAERRPDLIAPFAESLIELLDHKNNRLVWGAMTAIDAITALRKDLLLSNLDRLRRIADSGSVITRDHFVNILIKLAPTNPECCALLVEQLAACPPNQLPVYAERAYGLFSTASNDEFVAVLSSRIDEMKTDSKRTRLSKIIRKSTRT